MIREQLRHLIQQIRPRAAILSLGLVGIAWFVPLLGLLLLTAGMATFLRRASSVFEKLLLSFLIVIVGNIGVYTLCAVLHLHPPIALVGVVYALVGCATLLIAPWGKNPLLITRRDIICLIIAVVAGTIVLMPVMHSNAAAGGRAETVLHLLYSGEDNASHYALFTYFYQHDSFVYGTDAQKNGIIPGLTNYPQGSEFTFGWLAKSVLGQGYAGHHRALIIAYHLLGVGTFVLLLLMLAMLACRMYEQTKQSVSLLGGTLLMSVILCFGMTGPLLQLLSRGFHSQIFAYVLVIGLLYAMVMYRDRASSRKTFVLASLFFAGVCASWWFLAPVAAAPLVWLAWQQRAHWKQLIQTAALATPIVVLGLYPVLLGLFSSSKAGVLNAPGGVDVIAPVTLWLYGLGASLVLLLPKTARRVLVPLLITLSAAVAFTIAVGIYQQHTIGSYSYFYYKSLYTFLPLSVVLVGVVALHLSGALTSLLKPVQRVYLSVAIVVFASMATAWASKPIFPNVYLHDWFDNRSTPADLDTLFTQTGTGKYQEIIMVGGCHNGTTYMTNRWFGAFLLSEGRWHGDIDNATLYGNESWLIKLLRKAPYPKDKLFVYAPPNCVSPRMTQFLKGNGFTTNL